MSVTESVKSPSSNSSSARRISVRNEVGQEVPEEMSASKGVVNLFIVRRLRPLLELWDRRTVTDHRGPLWVSHGSWTSVAPWTDVQNKETVSEIF